MTAVYDSLNLREEGKKLIKQYTDDAIAYLHDTAMPTEAKQWFEDYAHKLLGRDK